MSGQQESIRRRTYSPPVVPPDSATEAPPSGLRASRLVVDRAQLCRGDALSFYPTWPSPKVIVSDGPYGLRSFPGDPPGTDRLVEMYQPHVAAWSERALPSTTLWF